MNLVFVKYDNTFDLSQIADSGQCFRLTEYHNKYYVAVTGNHMVEISYVPYPIEGYEFWCSREEFDTVWVPYFDLNTDYRQFQFKMVNDPFLREAIKVGGGIRILRQNLWETIVTFVISQRNNIPRIRSSVNKLCQAYGTLLGYDKFGNPHYSFPTAAQLRDKDLSVASLGYRSKYVEELTSYKDNLWEYLCQMSDIYAKDVLLQIKGVGEKVANCIMLFGLHRMNSYPKDVWINRMIDDVYGGEFDVSKYDGFAGYVQQLQFYYYRKMKKENKNNE